MQRLWPDPAPVEDVAELVAAAARPAPPERPWLLVNMIASLDGAITVDDRSGGLGRPADRAVFSALRAVADVVLAGAGTVRAEGYGPPRPSASARAARQARGQAAAPRLAVVSRSLELDVDAELFRAAEEPPLVLTCAAAPPERRRALDAVAEVVVAGDEAVDLVEALSELRRRGVATITAEGGPTLNGHLLAADVIDEWDLTVSPLLVGGDAGRAVVGPRLVEPREAELSWLLEGDGLLLGRWLRVR
ncbi:MAG: pyrimidine reductase family protein [Acidimicrobiia bacterium]